jgi:iron complex transport system permease protein
MEIVPVYADRRIMSVPLPGLRAAAITAMLALLVVLFLLRLAVGSVAIPLQDVIAVLTGGEAEKPVWQTIILEYRMPQALTAILAGAALGISGLLMQTLFRNPLADPFILGVSSGASLGVALVVLAMGSVTMKFLTGLSFIGDLTLAAAAIIGSSFVLLAVLVVSRRIANGMVLLILGLLFSYMTSAVVNLLLYFSIPERIQAYINWTFGSFSEVTWGQMPIVAPVILIGLACAFLLSKPLNALLLGEDYAWSLGINVRQIRTIVIIITALLAGTVTAFCGPIGFIGIAVPHLCRGLFGTADHRILIPTTIVMGAAVALAAALVSSVPGSNVILPLNTVTAAIGAPVVIWVILRRQTLKEAYSS